MSKICRCCGKEFNTQSGTRCNPCVWAASKIKNQQDKAPKRKPVVLGFNCPWSSSDFLRHWEGRLPDAGWGF